MPSAAHKEYISYLVSFFKKERKDIWLIYMYSALSGLVYLSLPLGIQAIVGFAMGGIMASSIFVIIFFVIVGTWVVGYLRVQVMEVIEKIQQKIFVEYSIAYAEKFSKLDLTQSNHYYLPELVNRIFDTHIMQKGVSKILLDIPIATIRIFIGIILLGFYHPLFIIFGMLIFLLVGIIYRITINAGIQTSIKESDKKYEVAYWLQTVADSIKSIKPYAQHNLHLHKVDNHLTDYLDHRTRHFGILKFQYKTIIAFKVITTLAMLLLSSYLLVNQKLNIGAFIAAELVIMTMINAVEKLVISLESYYDVITSLVKLNKVLELPEESSGSFSLPNSSGGLSVLCKNVSFAFSPQHPILKEVNLELPPNSLSVISGKMSAGKSTLIKVIGGFYQINTGSVLYDNLPIQNINRQDTSAVVGYYSDELKLFAGSVYENITLGNETITLDHINALAERLGIADIFHSLPKSYYTGIGESQNHLSYTYRKAILLLKTFLGNHRLLLLEEPLQGMNDTFCRNTITYLNEIAQYKTVIIVTEDSDIIAVAQHHFYVEDGQVKKMK